MIACTHPPGDTEVMRTTNLIGVSLGIEHCPTLWALAFKNVQSPPHPHPSPGCGRWGMTLVGGIKKGPCFLGAHKGRNDIVGIEIVGGLRSWCPLNFLKLIRSCPHTCIHVCTQFNVVEWLESYDPSMGERTQLPSNTRTLISHLGKNDEIWRSLIATMAFGVSSTLVSRSGSSQTGHACL